MLYNVLADLIVILHLIWILFMLIGFALILCGFFWKRFFDWCLFRILHLCGIVYVGLLGVLGEYCPLTMLENSLRARYDPGSGYPGSFIVHYIERLVYPDLSPMVILIPTVIIAIFTMTVFMLKPPAKIRKMFRWT